MELRSLGWTPGLQASFNELAAPPLVPMRVARQETNQYLVLGEAGERPARLSGLLRSRARRGEGAPVVGDWVVAEPAPGDGPWAVRDVLPRRAAFTRRAARDESREQVVAANVDVALLVSGLDAEFNPRRIERYLTVAKEGGAIPVLVLNKADVNVRPEEAAEAAAAVAPGIRVVLTSAADGRGIEALRALVPPGVTAVFLGSSGVGKSTLVNVLLGSEAMPTRPVRERDGRGRHTTTHRQLLPVPGGGVLIDTPGMRELGLWGGEEGLRDTFAEITLLAAGCRFRDCAHEAEPGCAVKVALEAGDLDAERYASFLKLRSEIARSERRRTEAGRRDERAQSRQWGKMGRSAMDAKRRRNRGE